MYSQTGCIGSALNTTGELSNGRSALIHSHPGSLSRGVSMPRIDQHALHLGSGIISPRRVQSLHFLRIISASPHSMLRECGFWSNSPRLGSHAQPLRAWPHGSSLRTLLLACSAFCRHPPIIQWMEQVIPPRLARRQITRPGLPSIQSRPPPLPRRRYSAAPLELLD